jgi:hypothetical protein
MGSGHPQRANPPGCRAKRAGSRVPTMTVLLVCHDLGVASQLDEVADRLAQQPLAVRHGSNRLLARAEKRRGPAGIIAGVIAAAWMAVSAFRRYPRPPDQLITRRLHEQATDVDRDWANADLALVADRLSPLVSAPDGPQGDALVIGASRRLVAWVAAGRSADGQMSAVEAAFAHWLQVAEEPDVASEALVQSLESYIDAWDAALRPTG